MPIPIPHGPCSKRKDYYYIRINVTRNRECTLNLLSDAAIPITFNTGHKIMAFYFVSMQVGQFYEPPVMWDTLRHPAAVKISPK